ncbi:hypothetical protein BKI52_42485 [marine bacterium AO1-C]|nr:hypothetical protein BKI52_42485 [marine bacterium AO1-C]
MKHSINPGWVITLFCLLFGLNLQGQDPRAIVSYASAAPDTIYYPYHNGLQMIEVHHLAHWKSQKSLYESQFRLKSMFRPYPVHPSVSNEYFFRDKQGNFIKAFNSFWALDSLKQFFRKGVVKFRSRKNRQVKSYMRPLPAKGHYKIFNVKRIKLKHQTPVLRRRTFGVQVMGRYPDMKFLKLRNVVYEYPYRSQSLDVIPGISYSNHIVNTQDLLFGVIDISGKVIVPIQYQELLLEQDLIFAKGNDKWGIIDRNNEVLFPLVFDEISRKSANLVVFKQNKKEALAVFHRRIFKLNDYDGIEECETYLIVTKNKKKGVLNNQGKQIIACAYDDLSFYDSDERRLFFIAKRNGRYGLISHKGQKLVPCQYALVRYDDQRKIYLFKKEGIEYRLSKSGKMIKDQ